MVTLRSGTRTHAPQQHTVQTRTMARGARSSVTVSRPGLARLEFVDQLPQRRRRIVQQHAPVAPSQEVVVAAEQPAAEIVDAAPPAAAEAQVDAAAVEAQADDAAAVEAQADDAHAVEAQADDADVGEQAGAMAPEVGICRTNPSKNRLYCARFANDEPSNMALPVQDTCSKLLVLTWRLVNTTALGLRI